MSSLQTMNNAAQTFSARMNTSVKSAGTWAKNLKVGKAARNLLLAPIYFLPWLLGRLFWYVKYFFGFIIVAFRNGAKLG